MISDTQNLSITCPNPSTRHFKPYVMHEAWVTESSRSLGGFRKKHYKNIHHLHLKLNNKPLPKQMPMPKTLYSVRIQAGRPGRSLPIIKKFVKPFRKYLRNVQGHAYHPKVLKLLPFLANARADLTQETLKMLALHSDIKKLHFDVASDRFSRVNGEELLLKSKSRLSRKLAKTHNLRALSIIVMSREVKAAKFLLELIEKNAHLDSLKDFSLNLVAGTFFFGSPLLNEEKFDISKILAKLTHLSSESMAWTSFIFSSGKLTNLSALNLELVLKEIYLESKDLLQLHSLSKLQKLTMRLTAQSLSSEMDFFENFSLPLSLEDLKLNFSGFSLSAINDNGPLSTKFFERLQKAKEVRALYLQIGENTSNLTLTAKFACLLIKCFSNLETLECRNFNETSLLVGNDLPQIQPLDFQDFWAAVMPSKETLQKISFSVNKVIFPERIYTTLETGFPRLQKFELQGAVLLTAELGKFCRKISSLRDVTLKEVKLKDEKELKVFLDDMREIPEGTRFELHLDIETVKQKPLIACLKKYIEDVQVKGKLGIYFRRVDVDNESAFGEIMKLVMEKGCFEPFKMTRVFNTLFSVMKTDIHEIAYGLSPN